MSEEIETKEEREKNKWKWWLIGAVWSVALIIIGISLQRLFKPSEAGIEVLKAELVEYTPRPAQGDAPPKEAHALIEFRNLGPKPIHEGNILFRGSNGAASISVDDGTARHVKFENELEIGDCPQDSVIKVLAWYTPTDSPPATPLIRSEHGGSIRAIVESFSSKEKWRLFFGLLLLVIALGLVGFIETRAKEERDKYKVAIGVVILLLFSSGMLPFLFFGFAR